MAEGRFLIESRAANRRLMRVFRTLLVVQPGILAQDERKPYPLLFYWLSTQGSRGGTPGEPVRFTVYLYLPGFVCLSRQVNLSPFAST